MLVCGPRAHYYLVRTPRFFLEPARLVVRSDQSQLITLDLERDTDGWAVASGDTAKLTAALSFADSLYAEIVAGEQSERFSQDIRQFSVAVTMAEDCKGFAWLNGERRSYSPLRARQQR
jgi:hypothetical protein